MPEPAQSAIVAGEAAREAGDAGDAPAPRHRGWYAFGVVVQVLVWALVFIGLAITIGVGGQLTEFRYVGF